MRGFVIGHGPGSGQMPGYRPYVPDRLAIEDSGHIRIVGRGERDVTESSLHGVESLASRGLFAVVPPEAAVPGSWPCVEDGGMRWFPLSDEARWRARRAEELLAEARVPGDPIGSVTRLRAAAAMAAVDLPSLLGKIESARAPGEPLDRAYDRIKK